MFRKYSFLYAVCFTAFLFSGKESELMLNKPSYKRVSTKTPFELLKAAAKNGDEKAVWKLLNKKENTFKSEEISGFLQQNKDFFKEEQVFLTPRIKQILGSLLVTNGFCSLAFNGYLLQSLTPSFAIGAKVFLDGSQVFFGTALILDGYLCKKNKRYLKIYKMLKKEAEKEDGDL